MAEAVLFSLATAILKSIGTEIAKPGGNYSSQIIPLLCCAEGELQSLEGTVETIKAVLLDAEKQQWHNNQVKLWLKRLKDVLYDVQDLLDDLATDDLRRKVTSGNNMLKEVCLFFSESNQLAHRFNVANKIRQLRMKLDRIACDNKFRFEQRPREENMAIGRGKKPEVLAPDTEIIGREKDKKEIIDHLFDSSPSQSVSVVSIVGKGGLGKTALARLAYNDGKVKEHFGLKMWVCVSDVFDAKLMIKEILKSAKDDCQGHDHEMEKSLQDLENKPLERLPSLLHETLRRKKYLLVLDDLWNEDRQKWLNLGDWLKDGMRGSKILVTTRSQKAAEFADKNSVLHFVSGLSEDKSWELFKKMAFGDGEESVDPRMEEIGRAIVKKCARVPLAIRTIGSFLYSKGYNEWPRFEKKELPEITKIDEDDEGIMQVLKFSYDHLPSCLKHCFAYCSLFPKDYVYDKEMMIYLWVAQGFIESPNGDDKLEEVAEDYLSVLLCRSFLDAETKGDDGEVLTFKMHDLMHDLAQKVAGDECKIVNFNGGGIGEIRHASFISEKMVSPTKTSKLRTLLFLGGDGLRKESSALDYDKIFPECSHCRALGLGKLDIPHSPSSFGKLKYLRFLDLSKNQSIESLTDSITDLLNLQTLKLSGCRNLKTLPRDLRKLVNLRHLLIDGYHSLTHMPCGLNHLSSLQTLSKFVVQKMDGEVPSGVGRVDELSGLDQLAGFITLQNLEFLQPTPYKCHFKEKERLRSLNLKWSTMQQDGKSESDELVVWENLRPHPNLADLSISSYMGRSPPSWLSSIKNLVGLTLQNCSGWKFLPPLSELRSLMEIRLEELSELEFIQEISEPKQSIVAHPFYPSLKKLCLLGCRNLKGWWGRRQLVGVDQDQRQHDLQSSFPKLSRLVIRNCPNLDSMPLFPRVEVFLSKVVGTKLLKQQLTAISNCPSEATVSTFIPLSNLEWIELEGQLELEHSMLETAFQFLSNLRTLELRDCKKLKSLSCGMRHLSSLQELHVDSCEELDLSSHDDEHGTQWRSLTKLRHLRLSGLPKLVALPQGIQRVITLQSLSIDSCNYLRSLPEWIGNLSSLQDLYIRHCVCLTSLPDGVLGLTSLKKLIIHRCPALETWYQNVTGANGEKIAHVPDLVFEYYGSTFPRWN